MDIKTVYGFILLGMCLAAQAICHKLGIDGDVTTTINLIVAGALLLISGKEIINKQK